MQDLANLRKLFAYENVHDSSTHVWHTQSIPTWLLNSVPRSVMAVHLPHRQYKLNRNCGFVNDGCSFRTVLEVISGSDYITIANGWSLSRGRLSQRPTAWKQREWLVLGVTLLLLSERMAYASEIAAMFEPVETHNRIQSTRLLYSEFPSFSHTFCFLTVPEWKIVWTPNAFQRSFTKVSISTPCVSQWRFYRLGIRLFKFQIIILLLSVWWLQKPEILSNGLPSLRPCVLWFSWTSSASQVLFRGPYETQVDTFTIHTRGYSM